MPLLLPRVYPLTDVGLSGLSHVEQVRRLGLGGASLIQLREKTQGARDFFESAKVAISAAHELGVKLIINDRADIAAAGGADGVHLGQDDVPVLAAREILGSAAIIGLSTHSLSQALEALRLPIDYLAVGPIFGTSTKSDTEPEVGLDGLREIRQRTGKFPLVAIGGITTNRAVDVIRAGADSVAVISDLLTIPDAISARTSALFQLLSTV